MLRCHYRKFAFAKEWVEGSHMQLQRGVGDLFMYQVRLRKMHDWATVRLGGREALKGLCVRCKSTPWGHEETMLRDSEAELIQHGELLNDR